MKTRYGWFIHLDGSGVADEGGGHLETSGWDVADGGLNVVRDPKHFVSKPPAKMHCCIS